MSEYCDDVAKLNKKEDMLLARKLRILDRQERVAQNIFRRSIHEAERLQVGNNLICINSLSFEFDNLFLNACVKHSYVVIL